MDIRLGIFVVPDATEGASTLDQIVAAEHAGLDLVGVQDHPYQWRFFDTWMLLAYAAGMTERVRLVPDVLNLPLRLPTLVAKSVASLDLLSGGRVELGLGAGAFWDAVEAMGGPRRTPKEVGRRPRGGSEHPARLLVRTALDHPRGHALPCQGRPPGPATGAPGRDLDRGMWTPDAEADRPTG
jgi:alkanesulfonate monooxygenase SsuD/methylene tetrahydromethanopterin reductase-like flavin-dependent oxidoreductase (luciferase family)